MTRSGLRKSQIGVVISVLTILGVFVFLQCGERNKEYTHKLADFKISIPSDLKLLETDNTQYTFGDGFGQVQVEAGYKRFKDVIREFDINSKRYLLFLREDRTIMPGEIDSLSAEDVKILLKSVGSSLADSWKTLATSYRSFKIVNEREGIMGGEPAYFVTYSGYRRGLSKDVPLIVEAAVILDRSTERFYFVVVQVIEKYYSKRQKSIADIMTSFQVLHQLNMKHEFE